MRGCGWMIELDLCLRVCHSRFSALDSAHLCIDDHANQSRNAHRCATQSAQLEVLMRHGSMELHRFSPTERSATFSSAALAHLAMAGAREQFRPFDGPAGGGLRQEWSQFRFHSM